MAEAPDTPLDFRARAWLGPAGAPPTIFFLMLRVKQPPNQSWKVHVPRRKHGSIHLFHPASRSPAPRRIPIDSGGSPSPTNPLGSRGPPADPVGRTFQSLSLYMRLLDGLKPRRRKPRGGEELIRGGLAAKERNSKREFVWSCPRLACPASRNGATRARRSCAPISTRTAAGCPLVGSGPPGRRPRRRPRRPRAAACARLGCRTCASLRPPRRRALSRTLPRPRRSLLGAAMASIRARKWRGLWTSSRMVRRCPRVLPSGGASIETRTSALGAARSSQHSSRKHHCRACGGVFCNSCSRWLKSLPLMGYDDPVRVCGYCFHESQGVAPPSSAGSTLARDEEEQNEKADDIANSSENDSQMANGRELADGSRRPLSSLDGNRNGSSDGRQRTASKKKTRKNKRSGSNRRKTTPLISAPRRWHSSTPQRTAAAAQSEEWPSQTCLTT